MTPGATPRRTARRAPGRVGGGGADQRALQQALVKRCHLSGEPASHLLKQGPLHLGAEGGVVRTGGRQERRAPRRGQRDGPVEQLLDAVDGSLTHRAPPVRAGASPRRRASQARANRHSRARVLNEIPRTAAVSSGLSPAK